MNRPILSLLLFLVLASVASQPLPAAPDENLARNPVIWADVPDIAIMRVGKTYYMSSTTMHTSPGLPIMESTDLVNWRMASYAYETSPTTKPSASKTAKTPTVKARGPAACVSTTACSMSRLSPPPADAPTSTPRGNDLRMR